MLKQRAILGVAMLVVALTIILAVIQESRFGTLLRYNLETKNLFSLRHSLNVMPAVASRLKIIGIDDETVALFRSDDLTLEEWAKVFSTLDSYRPRVILVDKLFDRPLGAGQGQVLRDALKELKTPVYTGSFYTRQEILGRKPVTTISASEGAFWVYGSDETFHEVLHFGHVLYEGRALFRPILQSGDDKKNFIAHLALVPFLDEMTLKRKRRFLNEEYLRVNLRHPLDFKKHAINMTDVVSANHREKLSLPLEFDDVVLILPALFSNTSDLVDSPLGNLHGGYVVASIVDSVLRDHYISVARHGFAFVILMALLGCLAFLLATERFRLKSVGSVLLVSFLMWLTAFFVFDVEVPFLFPATSYLLSVGVLSLNQYRLNSIRHLELEHEVKMTKLVQECFLRSETITQNRLVISGNVRPASECSGDWWGHFAIDDELYCVLVMDAVGHGTPAAMMTALTSAFASIMESINLKGFAEVKDPSVILTQLNAMFTRALQQRYHMTGIVAVFDTKNEKLHVGNAGHASPYLLSPAVSNEATVVKPIIGNANPIGISVDTTFKVKSYDIKAGDHLVFYTDGLFEATNQKKEAFGKRRLRTMLQQCHESSAEKVSAFIFNEVTNFVGKQVAEDDITLVVVEWQGGSDDSLGENASRTT